MAAKIKLTDEERTDVVDLYAIGFSTTRVIDYLLSTHPHWNVAPRYQIKDAIRTCNPYHVKFSKKWKLRFEGTKGHFRAHRDQLIEAASGHAAELMFDVYLKQSEIVKSTKILPMELSAPKDIIAFLRTLSDMYKALQPIAGPTENNKDSTSTGDREPLEQLRDEWRQLYPENSPSIPLPAAEENTSLNADSDRTEGEYHGYKNGA